MLAYSNVLREISLNTTNGYSVAEAVSPLPDPIWAPDMGDGHARDGVVPRLLLLELKNDQFVARTSIVLPRFK